MARTHRTTTSTISIANGQTTSSTFANQGANAAGLAMPATFTGTTISFLVSSDGATFVPLYDASNALVTQTVAASRAYTLPAALSAWPFWQVVSGSSEGGARTLTVSIQT